jgi:hypothetical protein
MVDKLGTDGEYHFISSYLSEVFHSWWPTMLALLGTRVLAMMPLVSDVSFVGYKGFGNDAMYGGQIGHMVVSTKLLLVIF